MSNGHVESTSDASGSTWMSTIYSKRKKKTRQYHRSSTPILAIAIERKKKEKK
jgi:hypothetical protein